MRFGKRDGLMAGTILYTEDDWDAARRFDKKMHTSVSFRTLTPEKRNYVERRWPYQNTKRRGRRCADTCAFSDVFLKTATTCFKPRSIVQSISSLPFIKNAIVNAPGGKVVFEK